jgi:prepilin-type N-terminal cleavage/methylation domain-containing protein
MNINKSAKGFTLIELLVVIAIIAILSVVVILTLNPAELLRQARDSNRVSDFATLKSAISLFEADVTTSSPSAIGTYGNLYISNPNTGTATGTANSAGGWVGPFNTSWGFATTSVIVQVASTTRGVNGNNGWIPVNFSLISSGAPIGNEPVDPSNTGSSTYAYSASSTVFKLAAKMESSKYSFGGGGDVVSSDGGNNTSTYEQGTNLAL